MSLELAIKQRNQARVTSTVFDLRRVTLNQAAVTEFKVNKATAGTFKYGHFFHDSGFILIIKALKTCNEYMLYEGVGCVYGGLYIVISYSSNKKRSPCIQSVGSTDFRIQLKSYSSIILIHYSSYSTYDTIIFRAYYKEKWAAASTYPVRSIIKGDTACVFVQRSTSITERYVQPFWMDLRRVRYVDIKVKLRSSEKLSYEFTASGSSESCIQCTVIFSPRHSNIIGGNHGVEICKKTSLRSDHIQSIFINMSMCDLFTSLLWRIVFSASVDIHRRSGVFLEGWNRTDYQLLPVFILNVYHISSQAERHPAWFLVHMTKHHYIPHYAIWRVWMKVNPTIARVLFEVLKNSTSSAVYQWNHQSVTDAYITIDKAVNFLFETANVPSGSRVTFTLWFIRHLIYEDSINEFVPKKMSGPSYITFHKFRCKGT